MRKLFKKQTKISDDERGSLAVHEPIHWQHHIPQQLADVWHKIAHVFGRHGTFVEHLLAVPKRTYIIASASVIGASSLAYATAFLWPQDVEFAHSAPETCFSNPTVLPWLQSTEASDSFSLHYANEVQLAGYPLYSSTTCVVQNRVAEENTEEVIKIAPLANPLLKKEITVSNPEYPQLVEQPGPTISISEPMALRLNAVDEQFDYVITIDQESKYCAVDQTEIICGVSDFELKQSQTYAVTFERYHKGEPVETLFEKDLKTVESVKVARTSFWQNQTLYDKPSQMVITFSKGIENFDGLSLTKASASGDIEVPFETEIRGKHLVILFSDELERGRTFKLKLNEVVAQDKGFLDKPFSRAFKTSVGPQVISQSFASYGLDQSATLSLSFDSAPEPSNIKQYFTLYAGNTAADFTVSVSGKTVTINPSQNLPFCANIRVAVANGMSNIFGVGDGIGSSRTSRTKCYTTSVIGSSVQGRSIVSYSFGSGSNVVAYVGGTHGDEYASVTTVYSWIDDLDRNFSDIPSGTRVVVVPLVNPDGYAAGTRVNANGVDLNRNFPANNWKKDVIMPDQTLNKNGGGTAPLSEPEAAAIANYIVALNPSLTLTYHSQGSLVVANESGNSLSKAETYGSLSGYWALGNSGLGDTFNYDTTGAFEDWLHDKYSLPALLVELGSHYGDHIYSNRDAMWAMIRN